MAPEPPKYMPEDILRAILSKLPVKYVVRYRCVCKTWYHIIGSTSLAKTHLNYQKTASNSNKCILYQKTAQPAQLCTLLPHSDSIYDGTLKHSKLYNMNGILRRYDITKIYDIPKIYGVCNGLLCLSAYHYHVRHDIYLWNPTCRKIKKLPQLDNSIKDAVTNTKKTTLSFGYHDDDFKVIVMAPLGNAYIVLVYSLNKNSWNMIQIEFHDDVFLKDHYYRCYPVNETKFVDGTVYIIETDHVRCFDLSNETIRVIWFPKEIGRCITPYHFTTETYGESIAIFKFERQSRSLTMWILKDKSSFASAWVKRLDNIEVSCQCYLVGLLNNGNYLVSWFEHGRRRCYLCDLDSPRLREVRFMRGSPCIRGHTHSNYVESLFLLNEDHLDPIVFYDINGKRVPESAGLTIHKAIQ